MSLPLEPPSHLPPHPSLQVVAEPGSEFPEPHRRSLLAVYLTHGDVSFPLTLSIHLALSGR